MDCNEELHEKMWKKEWAEDAHAAYHKGISDQRRRQVESGLVMLSTNLKNRRVYMQYTPKGERYREVFRLGEN